MKKILKWLWEDIKSDLQFMSDVAEGKKTLKLDRFKGIFDAEFFKMLFLFMLFMTAVFLSGWGLSAMHSQNLCNDYIYENYEVKNPLIKSEFHINFSQMLNNAKQNINGSNNK